MQHMRERLLWIRQWLDNDVQEMGPPSTTGPGNSLGDTISPITRAADPQPAATETDTSFVLVSNNDNQNTRNNNFGVLSIPDSEEVQIKDLPPLPSSHCSSCGWPFPPPPPSSHSEPIPPHQPTQDLEVAGRGDHFHVFSDLRSPSLARQRDKSAREKYYGFRYIKRGDLGSEGVLKERCSGPCCGAEEENENEHDDGDDKKGEYASSGAGSTPCSVTRTCSMERPQQPAIIANPPPPPPHTEEIDKHTLYRLAQLYPRPPKNHHRHIDKVIAPLSQRVDKRREERKHQKAILRDEIEDL